MVFFDYYIAMCGSNFVFYVSLITKYSHRNFNYFINLISRPDLHTRDQRRLTRSWENLTCQQFQYIKTCAYSTLKG